MGMVFKNIEYMNGGCFENLSGTFVPKSIGRGPRGCAMMQFSVIFTCDSPSKEKKSLKGLKQETIYISKTKSYVLVENGQNYMIFIANS
jgi:hypothetical protein